MRKIEKKMAEAIKERRSFKSGNTAVFITPHNDFVVQLHGNEIARLTGHFLRLSSCGWRTATTKSRLNAVLQAVGFPGSVYQHKHVWNLWRHPGSMAGRSVCPSMPFDDGMEIILA